MEIINTSYDDQLYIIPSIVKAVNELGFETMTPIQEQAIPLLLEGYDVIGQAQTGTGKTAAFGIPLLQKIDPENKHLQAIVLCPTRELAVQAAKEIRSFAKYLHGIRVLPVFGGQNIMEQIRGLRNTQIIVGTPGRVMDHMRRHTIKMEHVSMVVLDEADEMLNMGFREDMEVILGAIKHDHQTCLFSATMPQAILDITSMYQTDPQLIKITQEELTINLIKQYYYPIRKEYRLQAVERILMMNRYHRCMIFCNTKHSVDELSTELQKKGFAVDGLHGDLNQKQRDNVMGRFRNGNLEILIATDIAARGIDVDDVEAVINYNVPQETEYYVHRIGRTGRAGKEGVSHTLCTSRDFRKIREIEMVCHTTLEERSIPTIQEVTAHIEAQTLNKILSTLSEGNSEALVPMVESFCAEQNISPELLAAAFLKRELGEIDIEDVPINLPKKTVRTSSPERRGRDQGRQENNRDDRRNNRKNRNDYNDGENRRQRREHHHDRDSFAEKFEKKFRNNERRDSYSAQAKPKNDRRRKDMHGLRPSGTEFTRGGKKPHGRT